MSLFDFRCVNCGAVREDVRLSLDSIKENKNTRVSNLRRQGVICKCGNVNFIREISAHGKTSDNWSAWQRDPKGK